MLEKWLWTEKYRPKKIKDTILPQKLKNIFQSFVDQKNIPNLLLSGPSGTGKTTIAKAMLEELNCDYIIINGSMNGNIDTLRNEIQQFASSVSFTSTRKYVILDEADYLTSNTQAALRNFMEEYSSNCGFILTCNLKNKIMDALKSRCSLVDFSFSKSETVDLAPFFLKRLCNILDQENIEYNKSTVATLIKNFMPDWRRILNEVQKYSSFGKIDTGILLKSETSIDELVKFLKNKDFTNMRKWVAENSDIDPNYIFRKIYDQGSKFFTKETLPIAILIIGKYQYQHSFCADQEINLACCLTEIMADCEYA